jgi:threonine aldolase
MSPPTAWIDLRSDTVTRPDAEMRRAMAAAEVGDDVYGEDPTARTLEEESAAAMGCAGALFVPSGTMGNQIALHLHARPGSEVICDVRSHIVLHEMSAMAALSGLMPRTTVSADGILEPLDVERAVAVDVSLRSRPGVLALENSHNMAGGRCCDRRRWEALVAVARRHRLPVHLDGARIFNAAVALGVSPRVLTQGCDSVMFCLSKGLGAPVGSLLCGSAEFISEARRVRKMFGGGMRQVGVLAAAGLVALRRGPAHLATDHAHAARLALAIAGVEGLEIEPREVLTNIVFFRVTPEFAGATVSPEGPAAEVVARLRAGGVLATAMTADSVRLVTHRDVDGAAIDRVVELLPRLGAAGG